MRINKLKKKSLEQQSGRGHSVNDRLSPGGLFAKITFKGGSLFGRGAYSEVGAY